MNETERKKILDKVFHDLQIPKRLKEKQIENVTAFVDHNQPGILLLATINDNGHAELKTAEIRCDEQHIKETIDLLKSKIPNLHKTITSKILEDNNEAPSKAKIHMVN